MGARNVIVCAGIPRYGKSTFGLRYLCNANLTARFLFDPQPGEFNPDKGEFADRLALRPAIDQHTMVMGLCEGWVAFDPHTLFPGQLDKAFAVFCEWAWEMSLRLPGEKILVVDECWKYLNPYKIPLALTEAVQSGGKRGLGCLFNIQEPNRLHATIMNAVSEFVTFRLQSKQALDCAEEKGFNRAEVAGLRPLQFVSRNLDSGGELRGVITI
jgi:hypothetical protein